MSEGKFIIDTLRKFCEESGLDEQFDLRAHQCVGITEGGARTLRVWFNDGRIRDWDCQGWLAQAKGRELRLSEAAFFQKSATVWDGAPGFDFGDCHNSADSLDFDPYVVWVESKDVTRAVIAEESKTGRYDLPIECECSSAAENHSAYEKS